MSDCWTREAELRALEEWALGLDCAVEVGTWTGRSAERIVRGLRGTLFCVDDFRGVPGEDEDAARAEADWHRRMARWFDEGAAVLVKAESGDAVGVVKNLLYDRRVDMVFIDASHDYTSVKRDIELWKPLLSQGGVLCGHDFWMPGVRRAVRELLPTFRVGPDSLWRTEV